MTSTLLNKDWIQRIQAIPHFIWGGWHSIHMFMFCYDVYTSDWNLSIKGHVLNYFRFSIPNRVFVSALNFEGRTWSTTGLSSNLSTRKISLARSLPVIKFSGSQFTINSPEWTISFFTRFPIGQIPFHFRTLSKKIGKALWILTIVLRNAKLYFSPLFMKIQMK